MQYRIDIFDVMTGQGKQWTIDEETMSRIEMVLRAEQGEGKRFAYTRIKTTWPDGTGVTIDHDKPEGMR